MYINFCVLQVIVTKNQSTLLAVSDIISVLFNAGVFF